MGEIIKNEISLGGYMGFLDKLFKKKSEKKIYSDDNYIRSKTIYCDDGDITELPNIVILISFSNNYCQDAIDIAASNLKCVFIPSSIDTTLDELDDDGYNKIVSVPKNYLLIGGLTIDYIDLIQNTDISNPFISEIITELYNNVNSIFFTRLIADGVLNESLFKNENVQYEKLGIENFTIIDFYPILKQLPSEFTGGHLLKLFYFKDITSNKIYSYYNYLKYDYKNYYIEENILSEIYKGIIKHPTINNLVNLIDPLYKREVVDSETMTGTLTTSELDEIFQQEYDRFNAVIDYNMQYADIDEVLSEDDPEYNTIKGEDSVSEY